MKNVQQLVECKKAELTRFADELEGQAAQLQTRRNEVKEEASAARKEAERARRVTAAAAQALDDVAERIEAALPSGGLIRLFEGDKRSILEAIAREAREKAVALRGRSIRRRKS